MENALMQQPSHIFKTAPEFFCIYCIAMFSHNDVIKAGDLVVGNVIRNTCLHLADHALLQTCKRY